jgi:GNAT superfamily N-acetyltransferase
VINLLGAIVFSVYGLLIQAYPVAAVNGFIVLVNLYYLRGMLRTEEFFRLLEIKPDSDYLRYFLGFYRDQIQRYMPGFATPAPSTGGATLAVFVLRDLVPAGLLLGEARQQTLHVQLDFVIPQYRDFKIGRYLFDEQAEFFRSRGITEIVSAPGSNEHSAYLKRMGFTRDEEASTGLYRLSLD